MSAIRLWRCTWFCASGVGKCRQPLSGTRCDRPCPCPARRPTPVASASCGCAASHKAPAMPPNEKPTTRTRSRTGPAACNCCRPACRWAGKRPHRCSPRQVRVAKTGQVGHQHAPACIAQRGDVAHPMRPAAAAAMQQDQRWAARAAPSVPDRAAAITQGVQACGPGQRQGQFMG
jgi:hypothetical protein